MQILDGVKLDFDDVLIMPQRSTTCSRKDVDLSRQWCIPVPSGFEDVEGIPIISANMDTVGTLEMAYALEKLQCFSSLHKHYKQKQYVDYYLEHPNNHTFYSMGISSDELNKLFAILNELDYRNLVGAASDNLRYIMIDVANGYSDEFVHRVKTIRDKYPDKIIMAGNVCTREMTQELIQHGGVNIVKLGIGPGSVCETRRVAGVGYPQLSTIIECADAAHGLGALVCADGGCRTSGDVAKALGAGADLVMLGGMLAGTDECNGEWQYQPEHLAAYKTNDGKTSVQAVATGEWVKKSLKFYGMSSDDALQKHHGGKASYRASEGKTVEVPYKGPVKGVIEEICGGLRSTCAYVGASRIKDLSKRTTFVRVR